MRIPASVGTGTVLPGTKTVKPEKRKVSRSPKRPSTTPPRSPERLKELRAQRLTLRRKICEAPAKRKTKAWLKMMREECERLTDEIVSIEQHLAAGQPEPASAAPPVNVPKGFFLPGIAAYQTMDVPALLGHICGILCSQAQPLQAMLDRHVDADPVGAAELAEVLAISEEVASANGRTTDLDGRQITDWTEAQRFAAKIKQRAVLLYPPVTPRHRAFEVYFFVTGQDGDFQRSEEMLFPPVAGLAVELGGDPWHVAKVCWIQDGDSASLSDGWFECEVKGQRRHPAGYLAEHGWQTE